MLDLSCKLQQLGGKDAEEWPIRTEEEPRAQCSVRPQVVRLPEPNAAK